MKRHGGNATIDLMGSNKNSRWVFQSAQDVSRFWDVHRTVAARPAGGRGSNRQERFYLALYLLALADHNRLMYPLEVEEPRQDRSPNFILSSGESAGLLSGRASERSKPGLHWADVRARERWSHELNFAVLYNAKTLHSYRLPYRCDLLLCVEPPPGADRQSLLALMYQVVKRFQNFQQKLGKISIIASLDVFSDIAGECEVFPYIQPPQIVHPESVAAFSERMEFAARWSAESAVNRHLKSGVPVYSLEKGGHVVKQTPEGRNYDVKFEEDG